MDDQGEWVFCDVREEGVIKQNEILSETRVIEELERIRVALVKREDERPNFVFENLDLDQMRLFTKLRLDSVLKESKVTV